MTHATIERFAQLVDLDAPPLYLDGGDPRMRPAVTIAAALRSAGASAAPVLSDEARLAMRERLVAVAADQPATAHASGMAARVSRAADSGQRRAKDAGRKVSRRVSTLVGSVMILTSVAGVGVATARALPGSPFYDLKRATEAIQLWATSGEAAKGQRNLEFARTRLAEAAKLSPNSPYLASTLKAMNDETREANSELMQAYHQSGSIKPLADLVVFARQQYAELAKLGASLPQQLHQEATQSAALLTGVTAGVRDVTTGLCTLCRPGAHPSTTGPILAPSPTPTHGVAPTSHPTTPATTPNTTPSSQPHHLLPTLPPLLHNGSGKPLPKLSPLPLLSSLAQLFGG